MTERLRLIAVSMPSGVEHKRSSSSPSWPRSLIAVSMPSGVEHPKKYNWVLPLAILIAVSMPSGVEHGDGDTAFQFGSVSDRRLDALGR